MKPKRSPLPPWFPPVHGEDVGLKVYCSCTDAFDLDGFKRMEAGGVTHLLTTPWLFGGDIDYKQMIKGHPLETLRDGLQRFADTVIAKL